jgi:hypothetical protein
MEEKWVIGYREGRILMARSWTGELKAVADTRRQGPEIVVDRLHLADASFRMLGEAVPIFDWMLRSHALEQVLPLPVHEEGAALLESTPLAVFSLYGQVARCAATSWAPAPSKRVLRATSAIVTAVKGEEPAKIQRLAAAGHSLNSRACVGGFTALHVAAVKKSLPLVRQLLELGADPNVLADRNASVVIMALVHKAPIEMLELLVSRGADLGVPNQDGFGALHAAAEVDYVEPVPWLVSKGLDLEQRTHRGHTPLQIAAGLGHAAALNALLEAGADPSARSVDGATARDIAVTEGKNALVAALDAWTRR